MPLRLTCPTAAGDSARLHSPSFAPRHLYLGASLLAILGGNVAAYAGDSADQATMPGPQPQASELQEITVSAQRRQERLQDVPIALVAVNANALQQASVTDVGGLSLLAPSLNWAQEAAWAQPHLRGIGTTASGPGIESSVALYIDGVYYASMIGNNAVFNNVKDVEVINGPQGTLFGRNATGGLIQIITKDPTHDFNASGSVSYGNYQTAMADLYVTGGLSDTLAADIAINSQYQGQGYGTNITTGAEVKKNSYLVGRSKWLYTPSDVMKVTLAVDYGHVDFVPSIDQPPGTYPLGGGPILPPYDTIGPVNPGGWINEGGAAITIDYSAASFRFLSISAYRDLQSDTNESPLSTTSNPDFYGGFDGVETHRQFTQEFQFSSTGSGPVTWTTGAYYFHENSAYNPVHLFGTLFSPVSDIYYYTKNRTDSYALYGQSTFALTATTHLTTGLRYTVEPRSIEISNPVIIPGVGNVGPPDTTGSKSFKSPSWRLSLDHRFSEQVLGYVSYNRGFKSGGFNPAQLPAASFSPEKLDAYEIGLKTNSADNRLRLNVSPFYYKYKDMQVESFENAILLISNGASSELYGVDIDASAQLTQRLRLTAGASLVHSEFTSYPAAAITSPAPGGGTNYTTGSVAGNQLPLAPKAQVTAGLDYTIPSAVGAFVLNANYSYNSGWYAEPDNRLHQGAYNLVNSQLSWSPGDGKFQISLWGKNLTNALYATSLYSQSQGDAVEWAPPRTYGISLRASFK